MEPQQEVCTRPFNINCRVLIKVNGGMASHCCVPCENDIKTINFTLAQEQFIGNGLAEKTKSICHHLLDVEKKSVLSCDGVFSATFPKGSIIRTGELNQHKDVLHDDLE